ncbi:hypothetical protein BO86DRAFT_215222 [Aspergillus japonicus CBS 114.51]|uniref:Secreted protein n=1 Tax=Aspergillus japonicus CBS 114.51 TaxID=1448312 RepID=A0A8T8WPA0_ASPJA|nr:hypothetical protein BO86DRAFT_215222 [Aspergillus japonicus CBS 114.51]RAH77675.1 hypothetical protein BO86DRAFT_215222 [Aspergillus japonicus CBS 114.51]
MTSILCLVLLRLILNPWLGSSRLKRRKPQPPSLGESRAFPPATSSLPWEHLCWGIGFRLLRLPNPGADPRHRKGTKILKTGRFPRFNDDRVDQNGVIFRAEISLIEGILPTRFSSSCICSLATSDSTGG